MSPEQGFTVFGKEDVQIDVQIANYMASHTNENGFVVIGTDYKYLCLMDGASVLFSPDESNPWYLKMQDFRGAVNEAAGGIELLPLDFFVVYNLAPNDNMETHVKGVGIIKALALFAKWAAENHHRHGLSDYRSLIELVSQNEIVAWKIMAEMKTVYTKFAWNGVNSSYLSEPKTSEATPNQSMLSVFLNLKVDKNEFRREDLKNKVERILESSVNHQLLESSTNEQRDQELLSGIELNRRKRGKREEIAETRSGKATPYDVANMYALIEKHNLRETNALQKEFTLSKEAVKNDKKIRYGKSRQPPKKKQKQDADNEDLEERKRLKRVNEVSTIEVGSLSDMVGGEDREHFRKHLVRCVEHIRDIENKARIEGYHFFSAFLLKFETHEFDSFSQVVVNLKTFAKEFFEKEKHENEKRYNSRMKSIDGIEVKYRKSSQTTKAVGKENTKTSKKRMRENEDDEPKEDANEILRDILRRVLFFSDAYVRYRRFRSCY